MMRPGIIRCSRRTATGFWKTLADGHAERVAALHMIEPLADRSQAITHGADKADGGRPGQDQVPRPRPGRMGLHLRCCRLQSGAAAELLAA